MQLKLFFFLVSVAIAARAVTIAVVLTDLDNVKAQASSLENAINAFNSSDNGGSLADVSKIHDAATSTKFAIDTTTSDVQTLNTTVSVSDGQSVLQAIAVIEPFIEDALNAIVVKKAAFESLPLDCVSGLVKQDLEGLKNSTLTFEAALASKGPADLGDQAGAIKLVIDDAFAVAIAAYS